jgi:hypothetical protein
MRIGPLGLGRIGALHAETLTSLPAVGSLVVSDPAAAVAGKVAETLGARGQHPGGAAGVRGRRSPDPVILCLPALFPRKRRGTRARLEILIPILA